MAAMARLPEGTITFMLTDLQGSTQAWEKQPKAMRGAMSRHDAILASAVRDHEGALVEAGREGDSVLAVFKTAATAAACALDIQKNFAAESWPEGLNLNVRVALHTGEAQLRDGHYFGPALNRCARLLSTCNPGQVLLTKATEAILADELPQSAELRDLGLHRLKDLTRPEQVFQLNDLGALAEFPPIQSLPQQNTNTPHYLTDFIGRDAELSHLKSLVAKSRMVTLTGAGGSGKTRLAAELGRASLRLWPGGVWWVELAALNDPRQVPSAVVAALGLPGRERALDTATAWLANRRAVLVLDNCEHLVAACAEFCQAALERCPELGIIATSREPLGVGGEARWPVSSMKATDAMQLFESRARLVVPDFKVVATNSETVIQICERLDGMPLAIELAAARVGMMTVQEILTQLSDRFRLLTGGSRTAPERLQTMIATIDWSYQLLTETEALLFRRLTVFRGGFTLESTQAVCGDGIVGTVLDVLGGLVQKSMVVAERAEDSGSRYRLLESQIAFAEDRLRETQELELTRRHHYEYFLDYLGAELGPPVLPPSAPAVAETARIAREWANLWAAVRWARSSANDMGLLLAVRLAQTKFPDITATRRLLTDLLDHSQEMGPLRVLALISASGLANIQGDHDAALRTAEAGLALARGLTDVEAVAYALLEAGNVHHVHRDLDAAALMYGEATALLKDSKNTRLATGIRNNAALVAVELGDFTAARDILVECVATARAEGDVSGIATYLDSLAWAQLGLDDRQAAAANWNEALRMFRSVLDDTGIIFCLRGLSCLAGAKEDDSRALRLAAAAARLSDERSLRVDLWLVRYAEEFLHRSRSRLGNRMSEEAWNQGWVMTLDHAIEHALGESEPGVVGHQGPLSRREQEVAKLVAAGHTNREIAKRLFIAERSAEGHVERIRNKLGVRSRTEVATWAVEHGLTAPPIKEITHP